MLLGSLGACILRNLFAGKTIIRASGGTIGARQNF